MKVAKNKAKPVVRRNNKTSGPSFDGWNEWSGEKFHRHARNSHAFYYENYDIDKLVPEVWSWMKNNGYTSEQIKYAKAGKLAAYNSNVVVICKLLNSGMPDYYKAADEYWQSLNGTVGALSPKSEYIRARLQETIERGRNLTVTEETAAARYVPNIQERIMEQSYSATDAIDEWLSGIECKDFDPKGFDFKSHFAKMHVSQAHARFIVRCYEGQLAELRELQYISSTGRNAWVGLNEEEIDSLDQLMEGYRHLSKHNVNTYITALESIINACMLVMDVSKAKRKPRTAKPKSSDKLVARLKYCKVDDKNSIASINPREIIGATELWVFNSKTRKIGKYVAKNIDPSGLSRGSSGLSVKGTTIIGFDEELSIQKTLRKPELQIKEFKSTGKIGLRKFLGTIRSSESKLTGRINQDTVLLRVD